MYFKLLLIFILFSGCQPDFEPFVEDFPLTLSADAIKRCELENPKTKHACDIKHCLSSPITLLALQDLMEKTDAAFKRADIKYVLDGGSHIAERRFKAHLPWDDDADINVLAADFTPKKRAHLKRLLSADGLELEAFHTIMGLLNREGIYQVSYTKESFLKVIEKYEKIRGKTISEDDKENLWERYDAGGRLFPHLDILLWKEMGQNKILYQAEIFNENFKGIPIDKSLFFPANDVIVLGKTFKGMADFEAFAKAYFHTDNIITEFYINPEHKLHCDKIKFADIRNNVEYLQFFHEYLKFVFKNDGYNNSSLHPHLRSVLP